MEAGAIDLDAVRRRADDVRRIVSAAGRPVTVVAVTKGFGPGAVRAALAAGFHDVGENYAADLAAKARALSGEDVRWHFLGAVQRRKVRDLAPLVHLWQSVDREAAGVEIARRAPGASVLVEVDVTGAPGRVGCSFEEAPALVERLAGLGLDVRGLMAVAGIEDPRAQFRRLARLGTGLGLPELSMGMSGDLQVAVEEGATMVRVGRLLFGPRPVPDPEGRRG
ncbi:MAG TPA: YggS family pyridoxal phosphate enzyme [Acidimicrobiales bacterium]|nr:YggS family pyridoxal phosphate enzyme [Acidimicrobiales bacterium]